MSQSQQPVRDGQEGQHYIDAAIRIAFLGLILVWCFLIFRPFVTVIVWSIIIAVAAYPFVKKMAGWFGGKMKVATTVFVLLALALVLLPGIGLTGLIVKTGQSLGDGLENGTLKVPPPNESVKDWPLVGERVHGIWNEASINLERALMKYSEQVKSAVGWLFRSLAAVGVDILLTLFALILAGLLMNYADGANRSSIAFFDRIVGRHGKEYSDTSRDTIRSVVKGVVLVAVIQSVLAWVGMAFADVPAAGVWAILVLLLAVMQLPPILVLLPMIIYVFSEASSGVAIAFAIWSVIVSVSDSFLKPMFLGRGLKIPMLVILIGALGGMILHGIVGLFIGAVVMSLGYQLYQSWLNYWQLPEELEGATEPQTD